MPSCYICGDRKESDELTRGQWRGRAVTRCIDKEECLAEAREREQLWLETQEETPCLDAPWWAYR